MVSFLVFSVLALVALLLGAAEGSLLRASGKSTSGNATVFPPASANDRKLQDDNGGFGFLVSKIRDSTAWCLEATDGTTNGANLNLQFCDFDNAPPEQLWKFDVDGKLHTQLDESKCIVSGYGTSLFDGVRVRLNDCELDTNLKTLTLHDDSNDYFLTFNADPSYCVTNQGLHPHSGDRMHAKLCEDRNDYRWMFQPLSPPPDDAKSIISNQNTPGVCRGPWNRYPVIGCSYSNATSGNPNDLVNCFAAPYTPLNVTRVRFWLATPVPDSLSVRIWSGNLTGGPSEVVLDQPLDNITASLNNVDGLNDVTLESPVTMTDNGFCVGVHGGPDNEGFRLYTEPTSARSSFMSAPTCGIDSFVGASSYSMFRLLAFCIEADVEPVTEE